MSTIRRLLPATTIAAAAFSLGASSAEASVPCFKAYTPGWQVGNDGSLASALQGGGSAGDGGHGRLTVGGVAYPELAGSLCTQTDSSMSFPYRKLGGFTVARSISDVDGKLRWLDTIVNPGAGKAVSVDFALEVLPSQVIKTSESGNDTADEDDHWTVHQSQSLFSTHQWGQDGAVAQPDVVPEDGGARWEDDFGVMTDDATLHYSFFIGAGQTVRLLHGTGTADSLPAAKASAQNAAGLLAGYSRTTADDIVNFGDDVDGDGVNKFNDDCPSVKAQSANGCPQAPPQLKPADPIDPVEPSDPVDPVKPVEPSAPVVDPPTPVAPSGGAPASSTQGGTTTPVPAAPAADRNGPTVTFGVGRNLRRSQLVGRSGAKVTVACNEACRYTVKVAVKYRGRKTTTTVLRRSDANLSAQARQVRLRVAAKKLRKLSTAKVTLIVEATDRAGNRTTASKIVGLR